MIEQGETSRGVRVLFAGLVGALVGVLTSLVVNCTLLEISVNSFFGAYFGILFLLVAAVIFWRVHYGGHPRPRLLFTFSMLVGFSGLLCFVMEKTWFIHLKPRWKVPLYSVLGASICFALLFSLVDLLNYFSTLACCHRVCGGEEDQWSTGIGRVRGVGANIMPGVPVVDSASQVNLVVGAAVLMGLFFGYMFGRWDIEDQSQAMLQWALLREQRVCYPVGAVIGGITAAINQHMRDHRSDGFDILKDTDLDDDL